MISKKFQLAQTNICKGVAICIMLFHHLFFREDTWGLYWQSVHIGRWPLIAIIAVQGKICVTIFVLLSAYGLTLSAMKQGWQKKCGGGQSAVRSYSSFVVEHIKKLYYLYWPVFLPAMLIGLISGVSSPLTVYKSVGEFIRDFFGIAYIIDGKTPFNGAWWYISFALTFYLVFLILYKVMEKFPKGMLFISFMVGITQATEIPILIEWQRYFFVCCLGIYLAQQDLLNCIINKGRKRWRIAISGAMSFVLLLVRCIHAFTFDGFLALSIIVFCVSIFDSMKHFRELLISLGKHSGTMFLLHGLLYHNYLRDFIYGLWYPPLIYTVLMVLSYVLSVAVDQVKVKATSVVQIKR